MAAPGIYFVFSNQVAEMPEHMIQDVALKTGCIAVASTLEELERILCKMGSSEIVLTPKKENWEFLGQWQPGIGLENYAVSADIEVIKPLLVPSRHPLQPNFGTVCAHLASLFPSVSLRSREQVGRDRGDMNGPILTLPLLCDILDKRAYGVPPQRLIDFTRNNPRVILC